MPEYSVLAELDRVECTYHSTGADYVKVLCPFHEAEGSSPSCSVDIKSGRFSCFSSSCHRKGDLVLFLAKYTGRSLAEVTADLSERYGVRAKHAPVDPAQVEKLHQYLLSEKGTQLKELHRRAVTDDLIRKYRLGETSKCRVSIPIRDEEGSVLNIRYYLPGAPGHQKMTNMRRRGQPRVFPVEQLSYDSVMLCGGELKAIVAAAQLNPHGVGAVCVTTGEGPVPTALLRRFKDKTVYVCMDVDDAGVKAASVAAKSLYLTASTIYVVKLPLKTEDHPHGDVNDFVAAGGQLYPLLADLEEYAPPRAGLELDDGPPFDTTFSALTNPELVGRKIRFTATVTGIDEHSYTLPREVRPECDRGSQDFCTLCAVYQSKGTEKFSIPGDHPAVLDFIGGSTRAEHEAISEAIGIPRKCKVVTLHTDVHSSAEDVRLAPQLAITEMSRSKTGHHAALVDCDGDLNGTYEFTGRVWPHPKNHQTTLVISESRPIADALDSFEIQELELLRLFQPERWTLESLTTKLDELYEDLAHNVTKIIGRPEIHLMVDLAYHSVLLVEREHKAVKAWTDVLIIGDSSQGKSWVLDGMMGHYRLGEKAESKNMTRAGLLGGVDKTVGDKHMITWGIIPNNDRRLVAIEEAKGLKYETIGSMTDTRSSGIAELSMIKRRKTQARTRLIWITNARGDRPMASFSYGVEAVKELIGSLEDVRRFDAVLAVSLEDSVSESDYGEALRNSSIPHVYTADLCQKLVLWAWTRKVHQVEVPDDVWSVVLEKSKYLTSTYAEEVPIVDKGSMRYKLLRLSIALAARTFSTGDDLNVLHLRECHVEYVTQFLDRQYRSRGLGYYDYSQALSILKTIKDPDQIKVRVRETLHCEDFIDGLMTQDNIESSDIRDWCSMRREEADELLSFLVRKRALYRVGRSYRKSPTFITLLRELRQQLSVGDAPNYEEPGDEF
jgi:hypothetical protein